MIGIKCSEWYKRKQESNLHKGFIILKTTPRILSFAVGFKSCSSYFRSKNLVYKWRNRYVIRCRISAMEKSLLSGHKKGMLVTFTEFFNTSSLLSNNACLLINNACCTVTFRTCSNTSILIGKQIVYQILLADYQVTIKFKV